MMNMSQHGFHFVQFCNRLVVLHVSTKFSLPLHFLLSHAEHEVGNEEQHAKREKR
jgi:hypothetical protein